MEKVLLVPKKKDFIIRDPHTMKPLMADGEKKVLNSYWLKRIKCGEVEIKKGPQKGTKKEKK